MLNRIKKAKGGNIISMLAKRAAKADEAFEEAADVATKAKKANIAKGNNYDNMVQDLLDNDPRALDALSDEEFDMLVENVSPKMRAKLYGDDAVVGAMDETAMMLQDMPPEEVAQNLQFFTDIEDVANYTKGLNAADTRKFINSVSESDYDLFDGFEGFLNELGPRLQKSEGGESLMSAPTIEIEIESEGMKPDGEMEEDYVDYLLKETLSDEEYDYVDEQLSKDDKLSELFDIIVLAAGEFHADDNKVEGPGDGTSDDIPARLSDGEFVFTAKAVEVIGADKLQKMMEDAEAKYGKREDKAAGGLMSPTTPDMPTDPYALNQDTQNPEEAQLNQYMLAANQMPSVRKR